MAKPKLYHLVAERRAANAVYNHRHREKSAFFFIAETIRRLINDDGRNTKGIYYERRQAKKDKEQRLARKRRVRAKRAAEAKALNGTDSALVEPASRFMIHNPRRFLQAVVSDYVTTRHRQSLFQTVKALDALLEKLVAIGSSSDLLKAQTRFQTVVDWAEEIRIQVMRSYDLTDLWFRSCRFAFQQEHGDDGLGFTAETD
ncbi:hypothetical protein C8J56DRAFT_1059026 [Mycena floridula]|nr:hypothetical protein C8J56DRAFT_1059026 [Mycena floridula]